MLGAAKHWLNICSAAGNSGLRLTNGSAGGMDPENFAQARLILLWGTNPLTSGHHFWKFVQDAKANGAYVVAIDPIRTRTADQADRASGDPARHGRGARARPAERGARRGRAGRGVPGPARGRLGGLPRGDPEISGRDGGGDHRHPGRGHPQPGDAARAHPAHRHPRHHGHPAQRGRRHHDAHDRRHSRRDRRLAPPRRRRLLLHQRPRPPHHRHPRGPAARAGPHADDDPAGLGARQAATR